jgi:uncharacterized membrane protein YoaK (UPF0700 family)
MKTFVFFTKIFVAILIGRLVLNALEIFSYTRSWSVFLIPSALLIVIAWLFKILKKTIEDSEDQNDNNN